MKIAWTALTAACFAAALALTPVAATAAFDETTADPYAKADRTHIVIDGVITNIEGRRFALDYGDGHITVEMDTIGYDKDALPLEIGERVRVQGLMDADFYQKKTIEAGEVYSYDTASLYYADDADEESYDILTGLRSGETVEDRNTRISISGKVKAVRGTEFLLETAASGITVNVDVSSLGYDPLDDVGRRQVDVGDRVAVRGVLNRNFFDVNELHATTLVMLPYRKPGMVGDMPPPGQ